MGSDYSHGASYIGTPERETLATAAETVRHKGNGLGTSYREPQDSSIRTQVGIFLLDYYYIPTIFLLYSYYIPTIFLGFPT